LQIFIASNKAQPPSVIRTMRDISREGPTALWKGASAAFLRSMTYGGLRFGLYKPMKGMLAPGEQDLSIARKLMAALGSGGIASFLTNPIELVKVRLQADSSAAARPSLLAVARAVVHQRGLRGLWAGSLPSISRGATLTASQCVTYDETKQALAAATAWPRDSLGVHVLASVSSGLVSTTVTNPFDVVKTYMFLNRSTTVFECVRSIFVQEGPAAFFKGWLAGYLRLGPQTTLIFLFSEKLRQIFDLESV
jgi:solute carrier family 25 uncoupling protein 8/9